MSKKNPCLDCTLKNEAGELLLHADKNHPECRACTKRIEYVRSLGGMSESVPEFDKMDGDAGKNIEERIEELDFLAAQRLRKKMGGDVEDMSREQEIEIVIKDICEDCLTDVERVRDGGRRPEDSLARRKIVERLMADGFKVPQAKIAKLVGVTYPAVHLIAKRIKEGSYNTKPKKIIAEEYWLKYWEIFFEMPEHILNKVAIAFKYDISYDDFLILVTNEGGCRFCNKEGTDVKTNSVV